MNANNTVYKILFGLAFATLSTLASAGPEGRFAAVPIDGGLDFGADKVMLLDTVSGDLWIWVESPAVNDEPGGRYLIYQGQLKPGKHMGEIIEKQEWTPSEPSRK